jgi:hypothetical protein
MNNLKLAGIALALTAQACAGPIETKSTRLATPSSIELINAPSGAVLSVAGRQVPVSKGSALLEVADGWQDVKIMVGGQEALSRRIFVQDGSVKVIDFSAPK